MPGVKLVAEAFEEYWRKVPNIKRMEIYIVLSRATRLAMVRRGEVDIATQMQGVYYEQVKKDSDSPRDLSGEFLHLAYQSDLPMGSQVPMVGYSGTQGAPVLP